MTCNSVCSTKKKRCLSSDQLGDNDVKLKIEILPSFHKTSNTLLCDGGGYILIFTLILSM